MGGRPGISLASYIASAHYKLYAFYTGKGHLLEKMLRSVRGDPLVSETVGYMQYIGLQ